MAREILDTHASRLKTALRIEEDQDLPEEVQELYWRVERASRVIRNGGVTDDGLILIAVLAGGGEAPVTTFIDTARELDRGDRVLAKFRGEWTPGCYYGIKHNKILVTLDDDIEPQREFAATAVRLPSKDELALIEG